MSVIVSKRGHQKFGVITKALILARHTVKVCSNEKNFPKKFRWIFTKAYSYEVDEPVYVEDDHPYSGLLEEE